MLLWSVVAGCGVGALLVAAAARAPAGEDDIPITVRGPKSYAGPGSLGGTESALRAMTGGMRARRCGPSRPC